MDSFPRKDLSPAVSQQLTAALQEGEDFGLAPWIQAFLSNNHQPEPAPFPGPAERARALATVWSEAKYNFAYWDLLPGEAWWDRQFQDYLPLVMAAQTEAEYWEHLVRFGQLLGDGHTGVYLPHHLRRAETVPPIRLQAVEGRAIVVEGDALPPGTEILAVDGQPVRELRERMAPLIESSTAHYTEAASVARLLRGPAGSEVAVLARRWDGTEYEVTLRRSGQILPPPPVQVSKLGGGRLLVAINTFGEQEVAEAFHRHFPDFDDVTGIVIDLRRNGGGSSAVAHSVLARLLSAPTYAGAVRVGVYLPVLRAWGGNQRWLVVPPSEVVPDNTRPAFTGPITVLSSPFTASAAEDFLVAFKTSRRGPIVGQPSNGSTGQPLWAPLPGGGAFRVCCKRDTLPDGTVFVGKGIEPEIPCAPTVAGVASGRDEVLERAIRHLKQT